MSQASPQLVRALRDALGISNASDTTDLDLTLEELAGILDGMGIEMPEDQLQDLLAAIQHASAQSNEGQTVLPPVTFEPRSKAVPNVAINVPSPKSAPAAPDHVFPSTDSSSFIRVTEEGTGRSASWGGRDPTSPMATVNVAPAKASSPLAPLQPGAHAGGAAAIYDFLATVPHLSTLPTQELQMLHVNIRQYDALDVIVDDTVVDHLYVVIYGSVEVFHAGHRGPVRVGTITAPDIFGLEGIILEQDNTLTFRSGTDGTTIGVIPGSQILGAVKRSPFLAQSFARKISSTMDIFQCFQDYCRALFNNNSFSKVYLDVHKIMQAYTKLQNVIHPHLSDDVIDTGAWLYALRRLPDNITDTHVFDLAMSLPPFLSTSMREHCTTGTFDQKADVHFIPTVDRRRCAWQIGQNGKTLVLLREGFTDMIDFSTCFCVHLVESQKLRQRLQMMVSPPAVDLISDLRNSQEVTIEDIETMLEAMPLTAPERQGLKKLWPRDLVHRLYSILVHREEYTLRVDSSISRRFDADPYKQWVLLVRDTVLKAIGLGPLDPLPESIVIDVISSNTHTLKNLLNPFARRNWNKIMAWGKQNKPEIVDLYWHNQEDLCYCLMNHYFAQHEEERKEYALMLRDSGITVVTDTALTGLQFDLVDVSKLTSSVDTTLLPSYEQGRSNGRRYFIINMDFAFGAQADGITHALALTFAHRVRSFNVIGKAGGLVGIRGDIQLATHVIMSKSAQIQEDSTDDYLSCGNEDIHADRLRELCPRDVHEGPVLTIPGTMMQNPTLLRYYSKLWHCVGVEMEGSYFARQVQESVACGILHPDTMTRFLYYTSDLPLITSADSSLAVQMLPNEGIPPLYAVGRAVMERVLLPVH